MISSSASSSPPCCDIVSPAKPNSPFLPLLLRRSSPSHEATAVQFLLPPRRAAGAIPPPPLREDPDYIPSTYRVESPAQWRLGCMNFDDRNMDLIPFKLDIDELVDEFTEGNYTTLADMKWVWMGKKFSYIYEAKPNSNEAFFMQSLYSYSISHMVSTGALPRRLGGLYCLYCLYETQPYQPAFKIYSSLSELKRLKMLVIDAKKIGITVVPALVKRMLDKSMFLFGLVDTVSGYESQRFDEIMKLENKRVQIACEKLLGNTQIEDYVHMNFGMELELNTLKKMSKEYVEAKELAISEASDKVGVEDIKHIIEDKKLVGGMVEGIVKDWDAQKEALYKQTGISQRNELVAVDEFDELEHLLNE